MSRPWLRNPRVHLAAVLVAYAALAAGVQVHCADLLTSDGQCYLRMAVYYARGDLRHAVFGHWSPLGAWLTTPLVTAGMAPRHAFRLLLALWGGLAIVGAWRLAGRLGLPAASRGAATLCVALLVAELSADHRVDLLLTALLLCYLDAVMDERLLRSWRWALWVGVLGGAAYLAKLYALPFFVVHFTLTVLAQGWASGREPAGEGEGPSGRRGKRARAWPAKKLGVAWAAGAAGFALVAAPWVGALSAKYGRLTFGTAAATSYALVGPGSGDARRRAIAGLRRPPADAYNVWQDATQDATRPEQAGASPFSGSEAFARQLRVAGRNAARILGHLAALDVLHLGLAALALTPLALAATVARRQAALRYAVLLLTVAVFCGGYAFVQAESERYFWFVLVMTVVVAFHFASLVPRVAARLAQRLRRRETRLIAAAAALGLVAAFAYRPVVRLRWLLSQPPPGRQHRLVAERLAAWRVSGPLAAMGERGWWDGLHTAYYLDAKYAGTPQALDAAGVAAEMRQATATTLLVWGQPRWVEALRAEPAFRLLGTIKAESIAGLDHDVTVFSTRPEALPCRGGRSPQANGLWLRQASGLWLRLA